MIKKGIYSCLGIFVFWILLCLLQIWFDLLSADLFMKITFTLGGVFVALLAVVIVVGQYTSEKKLKDDDFLGG